MTRLLSLRLGLGLLLFYQLPTTHPFSHVFLPHKAHKTIIVHRAPFSSFTTHNLPPLASSGDYSIDEEDVDVQDYFMREDRMNEDLEDCILVGVEDLSHHRLTTSEKDILNFSQKYTLTESLTEMRELLKTAGLSITAEVTQRLNDPNPRTYIGTGKVDDITKLCKDLKCCTVVFDAELSPRQLKYLENSFNGKPIDEIYSGPTIKVVDRTALILDIFAQHAKTREGQLQVELALQTYRAPRLTKLWSHLERQSGSGGVGLRGPGEKQIEVDKRLMRDKIHSLKKQITQIQSQRNLHRKGRRSLGLPVVALVGYTNAGKSTLLNTLTSAGVMAENVLFATLDPTTRKVKLPGLKTHPEVMLTDTVGFIQNLPTHLVASFKATLEEVKMADVLVHVIDASNPMWGKQVNAVEGVLEEMGCGGKGVVRVYNKIDLLEEGVEGIMNEAAMQECSVAISCTQRLGLSDFVNSLEKKLSELMEDITCEIPYSKSKEVNLIHEVGNVEFVEYESESTIIKAKVPRAVSMRLEEYKINK
ncbi:hypothetical protein TrLO_g3242 [Triparma laevis f. longispina]|uniref:Hflx-type G domain-containing protein n=1 Tax=Triparma laevis f. longispina TaxID=1714387 RepID=A0A9W7E4Z8_9STRA|nr:hypothetical protein TrLO_g3242 [Triparma laevis f. longispina]